MNLSLVLDMACSGYPDRVAVTCDGSSLTYAELDQASRGVATVRARLRSSKTPDVVEFRDELPRTDTGKLLRRRVLEELVP